MKKIFVALAAALVVLAGCEKEEEKFVPQLSVDKQELSTGFEAAELSFTITANCAWTITTDAGEGEAWFEVTPAEGEGNAEVTVKVNANENEKGRTAVITVSYGPEELAQHEDIALVQDAEPVRHKGILQSAEFTKKDAEDLIMAARIEAGWITQADLDEMKAKAEAAAAAAAAEAEAAEAAAADKP